MTERTENSARIDLENPWPALLSFREQDAAFFGGREEVAERLCRRVAAEPLTLVHSPSGLGKTSLLRAGLFPRLRQEHFFPVYVRLEYVSGRSAVQQVKDAIVAQADATKLEFTPPLDAETLWEYFHRADVDFWDEWNFPLKPVLVFDQFEELFLKGAAMADELIDQLSALIEGTPPSIIETDEDEVEARKKYRIFGGRCRVVVAIRADYMARLDGISDRFRGIFSNRFGVKRLSGEDALKSVLKAGGHLIEPAVARRIVRFVGGIQNDAKEEPSPDENLSVSGLQIEPALLSVICSELNEIRKSTGAAKITATMLSGRRDEILSNFFDRSFVGTGSELREFVEDELVVQGGVTRDSISELKALQRPGVTKEALQKLIDRRVIRIEEIGAIRQVELTHDLLAGVAARGRDFREERRQTRAAIDAQLKAVEAAAQARTAYRRTQALAALFLLLIVGIIVIPMIVRKRTMAEERKNQARSAAVFARRAFELDRPGEGLAYLASALRLDPTSNVVRAVTYDELVHRPWPVLLSVFGGEEKIERAVIDDKATYAATVNDTRASIWDLRVGRRIAQFPSDRVSVLQSLSNGRFALTSATRRNILWDPVRGVLPLPFNAVISPDGEEFAYQEGNDLVIKSALTQKIVATQQDLAKGSHFMRWMPDGRHVLLLTPKAVLWDRVTRKTSMFPFEDVPWRSFSDDGKFIVAADGVMIRLYDTLSFKLAVDPILHVEYRPIAYQGGRIVRLTSSPDGKMLLVVTIDGTARLYLLSSGRSVGVPMKHSKAITSAIFSDDGLRILTASADKTVQCWDRTGKPVGAQIVHNHPVTAAAFSQDGQKIVTISDHVRIWRMAMALPEPVFSLSEDETPSWGTVFMFSRHIGVIDSSIRTAFRLNDGRKLWSLPAQKSSMVAAARTRPLIAASEDTPSQGHRLALLDAETGSPIWKRELPPHMDIGTAMFADGDRTLIAHVTSDNSWAGSQTEEQVRFYSAADGRESGQTIAVKGPVRIAASDTTLIALAMSDGRVKVKDWKSGREIGMASIPNTSPDSDPANIAFSRDGTRLLTASQEAGVSVWSVGQTIAPEGPLDLSKDTEHPGSALFSPDGSLIMTIAPTSIRVWTAKTRKPQGKPIETPDGEGSRFSDDGRRMIVQQLDNAEVWDVATISRLTHAARDADTFAILSEDGESVFTVQNSSLVRIRIPKTDDRRFDAMLLADFAEAIAGMEIVDAEPRVAEQPQQLAYLGKQCERNRDSVCAVILWFIRTPEATISPDSTMSVAEYFKKQAVKTPEQWMDLATLFPGHRALPEKPTPQQADEW